MDKNCLDGKISISFSDNWTFIDEQTLGAQFPETNRPFVAIVGKGDASVSGMLFYSDQI